jgi:hypothetical protein
MRIISPIDSPVKLWVLYQENTIAITGLIDLTVEVLDKDDSILLAGQTLTEVESTGRYEYSWDTTSVPQDTYAFAYFKKAGEIIHIEEYYFTIVEDADGMAL